MNHADSCFAFINQAIGKMERSLIGLAGMISDQNFENNLFIWPPQTEMM